MTVRQSRSLLMMTNRLMKAPTNNDNRFLIPALGIAAFAGLALVRALDGALYATILAWWGIEPYRTPFFDTDAITSAIECARRGVDVYLSNPCDELGRRWYAPLWLAAAAWPVTRSWTAPIGLGLDLLFLASLAALPQPTSRGQWWLTMAAVFSPMTIYAVERANNDLVIFLLVLGAGLAQGMPGKRHLLAYPLLLFAGLLKFYPLAAMGSALREGRRAFLAIAAASLAVLALFIAIFSRELPAALAVVPKGYNFSDWFGAELLPDGLIELQIKLPWLAQTEAAKLHLLAVVLFAVLALAAAGIAIDVSRKPGMRSLFAELPESKRNLLVLACLLLVGCFFAGPSIYYRGIFFILALPGLTAMAFGPERTEARRSLIRLVILVLLLMWSECLHKALLRLPHHEWPWAGLHRALVIAFWFLREIAWWWVIAVLGGLLLCFLSRSPILIRAFSQPTPWR